MKIDRIVYEQLFPTGVYANQRYRAEASLDDGENITDCYRALKDKIDQVFIVLNPQIQWSQPMFHPPTEEISTTPKEDATNKMLNAINTCTELKVLETYKLLVKNNPTFQGAYDNKLKSLQ